VTDAGADLEAVLGRLREVFDRSFALPARPAEGRRVRYLGIRVGGDPYAIRLDDISGIARGVEIAPVPTSAPALLGVLWARGALLPVYRLASILGLPHADRGTGWVAIVDRADPVAFAFDAVDSTFELEGHGPLDAAPAGAAGRFLAARLARPEGPARPVIDLPSAARSVKGVSEEVSKDPERRNAP
jgi:chemotaxis signal transduction protein